MEMEKVYNPQAIEGDLYKEWEESGAFVAKREEGKKPFTIVMPPAACRFILEAFGMNIGAEMMPGITLLVVGAFLGFFADGVCKNKKNVQPMRMLGTFLAIVGAIMVFIV